MENMINLGINEDMVKPIIEKQIQAAIVANLGNAEEFLGNMVQSILSKKVNIEGVHKNDSYYDKYDYLEILATKEVQKAAKEGLAEYFALKKDEIKQLVIDEMSKPSRQREFVNAFADTFAKSLECNWRFGCEISFNKLED